jgi:hypothetical protein
MWRITYSDVCEIEIIWCLESGMTSKHEAHRILNYGDEFLAYRIIEI